MPIALESISLAPGGSKDYNYRAFLGIIAHKIIVGTLLLLSWRKAHRGKRINVGNTEKCSSLPTSVLPPLKEVLI